MAAFGCCWWWLYQLTQKQAALCSLVISWLNDDWTRWWVVGRRDAGILVGYVWVEDWWVSYLWQDKVHLQVLFMVGLLDIKMIKLDCRKSHQRVSLYYCLLYIQYASELMTGIWKCGYVLISHIIWTWHYRKFYIDLCYKISSQIFPVLILKNVGFVIFIWHKFCFNNWQNLLALPT